MSIKEQIIDWIALRTGCRTTPEFYRQVQQNIDTLAEATGHQSLDALWKDLDENGKTSDAWLTSLGHCLDHTSSFLLTTNQYEVIGNKPLARLLKRNEEKKHIQVWCAGMGKGQEAFGIAMFLQNQIQHSQRWTIEILGTDIHPANVELASTKTFSPDAIPEDFPTAWKESFLEENDSAFTLHEDFKSNLTFKPLNLADSLSSIPICDIVIIRHVLPSLTDEVQVHFGAQLLNHLHPDSIVILEPGATAPGEAGLLKSIEPKLGLFQLNRKILPPEIFNRYEVDETSENNTFEKSLILDDIDQNADNRGYRKLQMSPEDYAWLIRYVRNLKLFENVPEAIIGEICKRIELFEFDLGVAMIQAGQPGEAFFIIYKGEVDVWSQGSILKKPVHSATLEPGDVFGEMSIILDVPANATVKGNDTTQVFALSRALFKYLLEKNQNFKNHLGSMVAERALDAGVKRSLLKSGLQLPELNVDFSVLKNLFGGASNDSERDNLETDDDIEDESQPVDPAVEEATKRDYLELLKLSKDLPIFNDAPLAELQPDPGQVLLYEFPTNYKIIKESKKPDAVYLIAEGRVRVSTGGKLFKKEIGLAILGRGQLVGEISLLRGGPSIAQVITQGEVRAFRIDRKLFKSWCEQSEDFRQNVEDIIEEREPPSSN